MPRIVVFSSRTGQGHMSLADALLDILDGASTLQIADPQPTLANWHYRMVSRHALWLWKAEYEFADTPARALAAHRLFNILISRRLDAILKFVRPDLVLTTYAFLTYAVARAIDRMRRRIPLLMLLSDPNCVHSAWLTERNSGAILAPTRETHATALRAGLTPDRVYLTGWPVRSQFYRTNNSIRSETLTRMDLDTTKFTVFLQGGGEGAAKFERAVASVLTVAESSMGLPIQLIIATGTNRCVAERFRGVYNTRIVPFTSEIAPYMAASDVVMGKVGPNTLFEAVVMGKPFIATTYIPCQEEANLEFIQRHQLGWVALEGRSQRELITALATEPEHLKAKYEMLKVYKQWNMEANKALQLAVHHAIG